VRVMFPLSRVVCGDDHVARTSWVALVPCTKADIVVLSGRAGRVAFKAARFFVNFSKRNVD
jgi:hypothetical protein